MDCQAAARFLASRPAPKDRCQSGRMSTLGKRVWQKCHRGFESHPVRQNRAIPASGLYAFTSLNSGAASPDGVEPVLLTPRTASDQIFFPGGKRGERRLKAECFVCALLKEWRCIACREMGSCYRTDFRHVEAEQTSSFPVDPRVHDHDSLLL